MTGKVILVIGNSDSGKDTVAGELIGYLYGKGVNARGLKWTAKMKEVFEYIYDLDAGDLDNKEVRARTIPGVDFTYSDMLLRAFTHLRAIDPLMFLRPTLETISNWCVWGIIPVLTDTRTRDEVDGILKLREDGKQVYVIRLTGRGKCKSPADDSLMDNYIKLSTCGANTLVLNNSGDLNTTMAILTPFLDEIAEG